MFNKPMIMILVLGGITAALLVGFYLFMTAA
jgi:hypothetical protein